MPNSYTMLQVPEFDGPCGPSDLANLFIQSRTTTPLGGTTKVSDDCIRKLISLCYYTSMAAEEERYPRFRACLVDRHMTTENLYVTAELQEHISLNGLDGVDALRKLSPAVSSFENALGLEEIEEQLVCTHLRISQPHYVPPKLGWPNLFDNSKQGNSVDVRVDGPGELDVSEGLPFASLSLRRGKITALAPWRLIPQITQWFSALAKKLAGRMESETDAKLFGGGEGAIRAILIDLWDSVVLDAVNRHRGATFIVLPDDIGGHEPSYRYQSDSFSMAEAVWMYWEVCRDYVSGEPAERDRIANRWLRVRLSLVSKTRSLANLGRVDGCVVVDRELQLRGFGGKIGFDDRDFTVPGLPHFDLLTKNVVEYGVKGGMRHKSAYWLCQVIPGTIAFVVSQDGDLTVFFSDSNHVHAIKVRA